MAEVAAVTAEPSLNVLAAQAGRPHALPACEGR
jgi:hypothetical protein